MITQVTPTKAREILLLHNDNFTLNYNGRSVLFQRDSRNREIRNKECNPAFICVLDVNGLDGGCDYEECEEKIEVARIQSFTIHKGSYDVDYAVSGS
jgi:hypothetical protein